MLYTAVHCPRMHCTALHCTALHCTALHYTALHFTALHCTALHCTALHCTALHCGPGGLAGRALHLLGEHGMQHTPAAHHAHHAAHTCTAVVPAHSTIPNPSCPPHLSRLWVWPSRNRNTLMGSLVRGGGQVRRKCLGEEVRREGWG
jgi:hypothetical protein